MRVSVTLCRFFFGVTTRLNASFCSFASRGGSGMQNGLPPADPPFIADMELYKAAAATELSCDCPAEGFGGP